MVVINEGCLLSVKQDIFDWYPLDPGYGQQIKKKKSSQGLEMPSGHLQALNKAIDDEKQEQGPISLGSDRAKSVMEGQDERWGKRSLIEMIHDPRVKG